MALAQVYVIGDDIDPILPRLFFADDAARTHPGELSALDAGARLVGNGAVWPHRVGGKEMVLDFAPGAGNQRGCCSGHDLLSLTGRA